LEPNELRELIELISRSNFVTFELEREGFKLKLEKGGAAAPSQVVVMPAAAPLPVAPSTLAAVAPPRRRPPRPLPPKPSTPASSR